jgi:hypothetical protein
MLSFHHQPSGQFQGLGRSPQKALSLATIAVLMGALVSAPLSVSAKPLFRSGNSSLPRPSLNTLPNRYTLSQSFNNGVIPAGTAIPVVYPEGETLQIRRGETRTLSLKTAVNLRQGNGAIVIPAGSTITGQLQPTNQGVIFVGQAVTLPNGQEVRINAVSQELVGFTSQNQGATAGDIIKGTLAGAGTATIIAGTTGDRRINALEVLGGAAVGALAGWGLPSAGILGGGTVEVMTINPSQDLTLTLQSPLSVNGNSVSYSGDYNYNYGRNANYW